MTKKLTFDEMYGLAKKVDLWRLDFRDINGFIDHHLAHYLGQVGEISIRITEVPSVRAYYKGVLLGNEEDKNNKLKRLRPQIYKKFSSQDNHAVCSIRNEGRSLARKLIQ